MSTFPPTLNARIRLQHGVVSAEQLAAHGITAQQRQTLVGTRVFRPLHQGVYVSAAVSIPSRRGALLRASPFLTSSSADRRRPGFATFVRCPTTPTSTP